MKTPICPGLGGMDTRSWPVKFEITLDGRKSEGWKSEGRNKYMKRWCPPKKKFEGKIKVRYNFEIFPQQIDFLIKWWVSLTRSKNV